MFQNDLDSFLLLNSQMWFWTGIKLPQNPVCQKRKKKRKRGAILTAIKSLIPVSAEMTLLKKAKDKRPEFKEESNKFTNRSV